MEVTISIKEARMPITVFHVKGSIDSNTNQALSAQIDAEIEKGTRNVLLDLTETEYISSAGLRAIHQTHTDLRKFSPKETGTMIMRGVRDGTYKSEHLKIATTNANILELFKTSGFDMYIEIFKTVEEAAAAF